MDLNFIIKVTLKEETWQFNQLLAGRELNDETKAEITELVMSDLPETLFANKHSIIIEEDK